MKRKFCSILAAAALACALSLSGAPAVYAATPSETAVADSADSSDHAAAVRISSELEELINAAAQIAESSTGQAEEISQQISAAQASMDALSGEEQEILSGSREALDNAAAAVNAFLNPIMDQHSLSSNGDHQNSFRYINGQPVSEALAAVRQENEAIKALAAGESEDAILALKNGTSASSDEDTSSENTSPENAAENAMADPDTQAVLLGSGENAKASGIDVSRWQGSIDWAAVKNSGVQFAIIRCGYGDDITSQDDEYWLKNVTACEQYHIPYGVYLYSYATDAAGAAREAAHAIRLLKGHSPSLPVYIDLEENALYNLGRDTVVTVANTFCSLLTSAGYTAGIYSNTSWWNRVLQPIARDSTYSHWISQWNSTCTANASYTLWQYSATGAVTGISGDVDLDRWYGGLIDVPANAWYHDAVSWALDKGVTYGTSESTFSPHNECTRAQIITFLWRYEGNPSTSTDSNPFSDVNVTKYYAEPVIWAYNCGVTTGTSDTTFGTDGEISRKDAVTFLWRLAGSPEPESSSPFTDVPGGEYYTDAVAWAAENGITNGTGNNCFSPDGICTRAQIVTFLYNASKADVIPEITAAS